MKEEENLKDNYDGLDKEVDVDESKEQWLFHKKIY
jgi:hypothetical protein